jgi:hypothetical protein
VVKLVMVMVLGFAPLFNLFVLGLLAVYCTELRSVGGVHRKNLRRVKNPMEGYFFLPEICGQLGKHCTTITIKTNGN